MDISKYTSSWFKQASLDELEEERELVRRDGFCNPSLPIEFRERCQNLLYKFDEYIRIARYGNKSDGDSPRVLHSGGWYIDDDD